MGNILVIEDDNEINRLLCTLLDKEGYWVKPAFSGTEGLLYFSMGSFDLLLVDLMLPGMSGEEVIKKIREKSDVPMIVISAKSDMDNKIALLENGANDYITKPFDVREVIARVKLQLKKEQSSNENETTSIVFGDLEIDDSSHTVRLLGNELVLTRQEYNILHLLFSNPNKAYTKQELYEQAWNEYYVGADKTLNVHISNIRNKFRQYTDDNYIETVWGIGFKAAKRKSGS